MTAQKAYLVFFFTQNTTAVVRAGPTEAHTQKSPTYIADDWKTLATTGYFRRISQNSDRYVPGQFSQNPSTTSSDISINRNDSR